MVVIVDSESRVEYFFRILLLAFGGLESGL